MLRDITIGQYYPAESRVHELDPRVKIAAVFIYLICGGDRFSGGSHHQIQSAFFLYFKRTETDFIPAFVYGSV